MWLVQFIKSIIWNARPVPAPSNTGVHVFKRVVDNSQEFACWRIYSIKSASNTESVTTVTSDFWNGVCSESLPKIAYRYLQTWSGLSGADFIVLQIDATTAYFKPSVPSYGRGDHVRDVNVARHLSLESKMNKLASTIATRLPGPCL